MDVRVNPPMMAPPVDRAWAVSMVIRSFKGRRDVEVHLYRAEAAARRGLRLGQPCWARCCPTPRPSPRPPGR